MVAISCAVPSSSIHHCFLGNLNGQADKQTDRQNHIHPETDSIQEFRNKYPLFPTLNTDFRRLFYFVSDPVDFTQRRSISLYCRVEARDDGDAPAWNGLWKILLGVDVDYGDRHQQSSAHHYDCRCWKLPCNWYNSQYAVYWTRNHPEQAHSHGEGRLGRYPSNLCFEDSTKEGADWGSYPSNSCFAPSPKNLTGTVSSYHFNYA